MSFACALSCVVSGSGPDCLTTDFREAHSSPFCICLVFWSKVCAPRPFMCNFIIILLLLYNFCYYYCIIIIGIIIIIIIIIMYTDLSNIMYMIQGYNKSNLIYIQYRSYVRRPVRLIPSCKELLWKETFRV